MYQIPQMCTKLCDWLKYINCKSAEITEIDNIANIAKISNEITKMSNTTQIAKGLKGWESANKGGCDL